MSDDLKPCPFCGSGLAKGPGRYTQASFSGVEVMDDLTNPYVWCGTCCARTLTCDSVAEAIAAWNTRATPAPHDVQGLIERLRQPLTATPTSSMNAMSDAADALVQRDAEIARQRREIDRLNDEANNVALSAIALEKENSRLKALLDYVVNECSTWRHPLADKLLAKLGGSDAEVR